MRIRRPPKGHGLDCEEGEADGNDGDGCCELMATYHVVSSPGRLLARQREVALLVTPPRTTLK